MEAPKTEAKKEDKRRQICLENLRKGREKLMKLRAKGFSTRVPIKGKNKKTPQYKKRGFKLESESDSESDSETETDTETESESESEEEQTKKKKQPKRQVAKKQKGKGGKISKLKGEMEEMKGIINQLKNTKLHEPKQKEKVVINMLNPHQPSSTKSGTDYDSLLKKAMFGNL